jgi:hypothetical protein
MGTGYKGPKTKLLNTTLMNPPRMGAASMPVPYGSKRFYCLNNSKYKKT